MWWRHKRNLCYPLRPCPHYSLIENSVRLLKANDNCLHFFKNICLNGMEIICMSVLRLSWKFSQVADLRQLSAQCSIELPNVTSNKAGLVNLQLLFHLIIPPLTLVHCQDLITGWVVVESVVFVVEGIGVVEVEVDGGNSYL